MSEKELPEEDGQMLDFTEDILNGMLEQEQRDPLRKRPKKRLTRLHSWFVRLHETEDGGPVLIAHGLVTGHPSLEDDDFIHTSQVISINVDKAACQVLIRTRNTDYHCSIRDCNLIQQLQQESPELAELLEYAGEWAEATQTAFGLRDNAVLLQLSEARYHYFAAAVALRRGELSILTLQEAAGVCEEQCLVRGGRLQLKYLPLPDGIELTDTCLYQQRLFIENVGEERLHIYHNNDCLEIWPGERRMLLSLKGNSPKNK